MQMIIFLLSYMIMNSTSLCLTDIYKWISRCLCSQNKVLNSKAFLFADDHVFLPNEAERQEYVLNDEGVIYQGSSTSVTERPWTYGQVSTKPQSHTNHKVIY